MYFTWDPVLKLKTETLAKLVLKLRPDLFVIDAGLWLVWLQYGRDRRENTETALANALARRLEELLLIRDRTGVIGYSIDMYPDCL